ncbi:MAG: hypothetical protein L0Y56_06795 [Nitrospira sp.]|nr:hypothetical protein [Nitrospira sp.]
MTSIKKWTGWILIMMIFSANALWSLASAANAQTPAASRPTQAAKPSPKEKRIIILGTTIVGSITKPGVVYEVPWKEPEFLKKGLDEPQRSFQNEIFSPLDKEQFESQMKP